MRFELSDDKWVLLEPLIPKSRMSARVDDRMILNGIFYVLRVSCRGAICRNAMGAIQRCTIASTIGLGAASGSGSPKRNLIGQGNAFEVVSHNRLSTSTPQALMLFFVR
jgi:transposase